MKPYNKPTNFDYNLIVIGAGAGGLVSSYIAAAVKAKVLLIEKNTMGGDCLNTGCVPSKALIQSARILSYAKRAREFGFNKTDIDYNFSTVMERVKKIIARIAPHDSIERYNNLGVEVIQGEALLKTPYEVIVNKKIYTSRNIIIASGAKPFIPNLPGLDKIAYLTSDTLWSLRERPQRFLILGGGPIGCELAQCFARLGSEVTIIERGPQIMPREDPDIAAIITQRFTAENINILTEHNALRFLNNGQQQLICLHNNQEVAINFDKVLIALGRHANTQGIGLENLDLKLSPDGTIQHDHFLRTNYANIYVCGDVAGPYQFTHTAAHQAWYASVNALFSPFKKFRVDYSTIPWATFTDPEVARVGLNEADAQKLKINYEISSYNLNDLDRAITDNEALGTVKVLTAPGKDKILGVTIVAHHAGDMIAEFVLAMKHNIGLNKILGTIHIYPTFAEANKYVAGVWRRKHQPKILLQLIEKFHRWRRN